MNFDEWVQMYKAENASVDFPPGIRIAYEAGRVQQREADARYCETLEPGYYVIEDKRTRHEIGPMEEVAKRIRAGGAE